MKKKLDNKLLAVWKEYLALKRRLKEPKVLQNIALFTTLSQKLKPLTVGGNLLDQKHKLEQTIKELEELGQDVDLQNEVAKEKTQLEAKLDNLESKIKDWWLNYQQAQFTVASVILELRSATGGDEASLFVADVCEMYLNYFKKTNWEFKILEQRKNSGGGYNYVVLRINSREAFNKLRFEGGVHRVQRVPKTETQGRVHTSTITVAVLEKVTEKKFPLAAKDLRIDTFRSSGAGGQSVNTTDSAVRIVHLPTGMKVSCQDGRSQHDNKERAMEVLRARLYKQQQESNLEKSQSHRQKQIGAGMRSEKIRTYNYPQNRITDHRIKTSFSGIEQIMNGNLEKIITQLQLKLSMDHG